MSFTNMSIKVCPKNGFAPKYERLGDQKADSCTNPQNQALAAAHLSQILQKSYCCSENTKCTMVTMQIRCNSPKKYLNNAKKMTN